MYFTKEDLRTIEEYLKLKSKRDSLFDAINPNDLLDKDTIVVVHDYENKNISLGNFLSSEIVNSLIALKILLYETYRLQLDNELRFLKELIKNFQENKIGIVNNFGDSPTYGISLRVLTNKIEELEELIRNSMSIEMEEVSAENKTVITKYHAITVKLGGEIVAEYITPTVELVPIIYPKVVFIPSDEVLSALEIEAYVASHDYEQTSFNYTKLLTTKNYYVVLEKNHALEQVVNSAGFSYKQAFSQESSSTYNIYHYNRTLTVPINLTFTLN